VNFPSIEPSIVMVTPEIAEQWLGLNTHNRNLRKRSLVTSYARDMAKGNWQFTGEAIKFAPDGRLLDGQHRLHAVIQSGASIRMLVVRNVPESAQEVMDSGAARRAGDSLALRGERNTGLLASAASAVITECGRDRGKITHSEVIKALENDESIRWIVHEVLPAIKLGAILTPTVTFYAYWKLNQIDSSDAAKFFDGLSTMANIPTGSPILALHRRLTGNLKRKSGSYAYRQEVLACIFSAWNSWRKGEQRSKIQVTFSEFGRVQIPEPK
jgi:hypothetical protein